MRYVSDRSLPDKAIDLIDEASARVRMKLTTTPDELRAMQHEIRELQTQKEEAIAGAGLRDRGQLPRQGKEAQGQVRLPGDASGATSSARPSRT